MEGKEKPRCASCEFEFFNESFYHIKTKRGMTQPCKRHCQHPKRKNRIISSRALGEYGYPIWCPLNTLKSTCIVCGTIIREEEGEYCKKHRPKGPVVNTDETEEELKWD